MGGFWERLVKVVKRPLRKILGASTLRYNKMLTLLYEIEKMINNRPLTHIYSDEYDHHETLTPNHLIFGSRMNCEAKNVV